MAEVRISLTQRVAQLQLDDGRTLSFPVGIGRDETPTPIGTWHVVAHRQERQGDTTVEVLELHTPRTICLRGHPDLSSLGRACSGG